MGPNSKEYPSRSQQVVLLVLAAILVAAGVAGGQWFMDADYVVYGYMDQTEWTVTAGYTVGEFWGLVLQTVCLPGAAIALLMWISFFYKSPAWPSWLKAVMFFTLMLVLLECAIIASDMTDGLVECLWSLCQDFSTSSSSDAFTAFIPTVGVMYFCVLGMFAFLATGLLVRTAADMLGITSKRGSVRGLAWGGAANNLEEYQPLLSSTSSSARASAAVVTGTTTVAGSGSDSFGGGGGDDGPGSNRLATSSFASAFVVGSMERQRRVARRIISATWLIGVFCCFFPVFIFASMAIGDDWEHMTVSGVQSYASSSATQEYGTIWNFRLSSSLVLKLYPDVLIYWGFIYLVVFIALLARAWSPVRSFFAAPFGIRIGSGSRRSSWSNGQAFLVLTFFALLFSEGFYWYFDHGWGSTVTTDKTWQERLARTMGQLANVTMGLMILPVTRNGVMEKVFGVGCESMVAYHRRMARAFLALVLAHMVLFWWVYWQNDDFWHDWPIAIPTDYHYDNWTIPLATLTTWAMVVLMFGFSLERVRRARYELFYYSHHFFIVVWAMMLWHAASAWYYVAGSIALWILDRFIRVSKGLSMVSVKGFKSFGGVTRLSYTVESGGAGPWGESQKAMLHEAGQYVFLNVPAISLLEWHPFTISSCPDDQETTHHIKDMGPHTFTHKLRMLAALGEGLTVNVDGPYGVSLEYKRYRLLVLVAGGIGVTPCVSLLRHLNHLSRAGRLTHCLDAGVRLIWSTRSMEELIMLERELQDVAEEGEVAEEAHHARSARLRFSVHLHLTAGVSPDNSDNGDSDYSGGSSSTRTTCLPYTEGRPDLPTYLARFSPQPLSSSHSATAAAGSSAAAAAVALVIGSDHKASSRDVDLSARGVGGKETPSGRVKGLVFACGPSVLMEAAREAAEDAGMDFQGETFEL